MSLQKQYQQLAKLLLLEEGIDYASKHKGTIDKLANGYCEAKDSGDEHKKDLYISGLMLRFWYIIGKLQEKCPGLSLSKDDFADWLYEAIEYACKYRAWQKADSKVNAQQCINQCIETIRSQHYYQFNLQKHKANQNNVSFETTIDDDNKLTLYDITPDEDASDEMERSLEAVSVKEYIQRYIDNKQLVEAIILDIIAFRDTERVTKKIHKKKDEEGNTYKYTTETAQFQSSKCIRELVQLSDDYLKYFTTSYKVNLPEIQAAYDAIKAANNNKLNKYLSKTLLMAKATMSR